MTGLHDHEYVRVAAVEAGQRAKARISEAALRSAGLADCERRCRKIRRRFDEELRLIREVARHAGPAPPSLSKRFTVEIVKALPDKMQVFGWASVVAKGPMGARRLVFDRQGDAIDIDALADAAHKFVKSGRHTGGDMHVKKGCAKLVASIVLDDATQRALGIDCGQTGWFVGFELDPDTYALVKSGQRSAFSISGSAIRVPYETWAKEA